MCKPDMNVKGLTNILSTLGFLYGKEIDWEYLLNWRYNSMWVKEL